MDWHGDGAAIHSAHEVARIAAHRPRPMPPWDTPPKPPLTIDCGLGLFGRGSGVVRRPTSVCGCCRGAARRRLLRRTCATRATARDGCGCGVARDAGRSRARAREAAALLSLYELIPELLGGVEALCAWLEDTYGALRWWRVPPLLWLCPCFTRRFNFRPSTVERCRALVLQYVVVLIVTGVAQVTTYYVGVRHASYVKVRRHTRGDGAPDRPAARLPLPAIQFELGLVAPRSVASPHGLHSRTTVDPSPSLPLRTFIGQLTSLNSVALMSIIVNYSL